MKLALTRSSRGGSYAASVFCLLSFATTSASPAESDRHNVVLILADDLGWSDTTLYGTTKLYRTPQLARLASRGMTFTRAYSVSPLCSPTRSAILTGLHPARTGLTSPNCHLPQIVLEATPARSGPPNAKATTVDSVTRLDTKYETLSRALRRAGYATGHFGKWHLGHEPYSPLEHGFDIDIPHWPGPGPAGSYVAPWKFPDFDPDTPRQHIEDRMAQEAVSFIDRHRDRPFFLNYWMFSVHAPFDAKSELIDKYRSKVDPADPQRSPTYAAMIESMDDAVGTLLDALEERHLADRTIIIFASDNGGNMYNEVDGTTPTSNAPLRGGKATMYEGGIRGPCVVVWPGVVAGGSRSDAVIQSCDFYPTLLELLDIEPQPQQFFDGISIVPALKSISLNRDAIFTYFPHAPRVPDWLPPSIAVHRGDWKLIRIFHGGEDGGHRWKLFNLREDPGEQQDLATALPQRVAELDSLIDGFLADTAAVQPLPNPDFDPSKYRPEEEGQSRMNTPKRAGNPSKGPTRVAAFVAGWRPEKDCRVSVKDGMLLINSTGRDPHLSFRLAAPLPAGSLTLQFTLQAEAKGEGQVFWQEQGVTPAFFRDRSCIFPIKHDGQSHRYRIQLDTKQPVLAIRLDPAQGPGKIVVSDMQLTNAAGKVVLSWTFP